MADYWKSLPKKYCEICKVWFADNKASVEFHERGFKHKINLQKKLQELQKRGAKQDREQMKYNAEMLKIECSAIKSFQNDISQNPQLAKEMTSNIPLIKRSGIKNNTSAFMCGNRFGDDANDCEESRTLVFGREKALNTIAQKFEKKSRWLEAKTAEGKSYYWNKETFETKWTEPKSGYLSVEEQKCVPDVNIAQESGCSVRYDPYGKWSAVKDQAFDDKMIDLQLPDQELQFVAPVVVHRDPIDIKIDFKEKTLDSVNGLSKTSANDKTTFKKRKSHAENKRNLRTKTDDL